MKKLVNFLCTKILSFFHKQTLPVYSGDFCITPKPNYLSQFANIYPSSLKISDLLDNPVDIKKYGAKDADELSFWAWRNCGITCVKMILEAKNKGKNKTMMDLTNEGIQLGGYITYLDGKLVDKGWFHHSLVSLLKNHGLSASMKKWQTLESVAKDILNNKLVILSLYLPGRSYISEDGSFLAKNNAKYGGHLVLATGVKMSGKNIEGIYVHDPRGLPNYQEDTWIPSEVFHMIFTNRTIVVE